MRPSTSGFMPAWGTRSASTKCARSTRSCRRSRTRQAVAGIRYTARRFIHQEISGMRNVRFTGVLTALLLGVAALVGFGSRLAGQSPGNSGAPVFKVDPTWPLEMPNKWILGAVTGVFVDAKQHVWVTHLPETLTEEETSAEQKPPIGTCCAAAPPVVEFDAQGKVVQGWGQGSMDDTANWPRNPH